MYSYAKKITFLLLLASIILTAGNAFAIVEGLRVSTPDTCWYSGNFIDLPVRIEWTDWSRYDYCGAEYWVPDQYDLAPYSPSSHRCDRFTSTETTMCGFEMMLTFDNDVVQAVTVTGADLIKQWHWPDVYFEINNDQGWIKIAAASASCPDINNITDPTDLVKIGFLVMGQDLEDANLQMEYFKYNETDGAYIYWNNNDFTGRPDSRSIGKLTVCPSLCISGRINYCSNNQPVCGADVTLSYKPDTTVVPPPDIDDITVQTRCENNCEEDCRGSYILCDAVGTYDYCLSAWKDDEYDNAVTAFDASIVLRYLVNQLTLNCCQKAAADVTGDGCITNFDASKILQFVIGEFDYFPKKEAEQTNWLFFYDSDHSGCGKDADCLLPIEKYCYTPLNTDQVDQDFDAVILGDVSGNWGISTNGKVVADVNFTTRLVEKRADGSMVYEVTSTAPEAYGWQFTVNTNTPELVTVANDGSASLVSGVQGERIIVAAASATPSHTLGQIIIQPGAGEVTLDNFVINERSYDASVTLKEGAGSLPSTFVLDDAYPNPFNPSTNISFGLPSAATVHLNIYNILGRKVKTLASGTYEAGTHVIVWDGTNDAGEVVSSGLYFYRMETPEFTTTKKVVLLK